MDITKIQTLIAQGKVVLLSDIDPTESYLQVGVYQPNNRRIGSGNPDTYPSVVMALSDIITPRVQSVISAATVTPTNLNDEVVITAQASALFLANPTGTAVQGQSMLIRIKDNGTARAITYGTEYRAVGVTLPTTTVINKTVYLGLVYNATDTKWDVIGVAQEA